MKRTSENNRNWSQYNRQLVKNGRINFWFDEKLLENWYASEEQSMIERGRPNTYSDEAIKFCQVVRFVYKQPLRQTEGLVGSILELAKPGLKAPCYTQISRRMEDVDILIKKQLSKINSGEVIHVLFDSSGLKVYGEGEWKVRKHGYSKRRTWRKLHICIDAVTQKIVSHELTENDIDDAKTADGMIKELPSSVQMMSGDGAYDTKEIYNAGHAKGIKVVVPPDKNAVINRNYNKEKNPGIAERNKALLEIQKNMFNENLTHEEARKKWKIDNNYHQRSKAETAFYRFKGRLGDKLSSREFAHQKIESGIKCYILNKFAA